MQVSIHNPTGVRIRSMFPLVFTFLTVMLLLPLLLLPAASSLRLNSDTEDNKSGPRGQEVTYNISINNNRIYPVDIKAEISGSTWDAALENDEFMWVLPDEDVQFTVSIRIPEKPNSSHSTTGIDLFERPSADGMTRYEKEVMIEINTTLSEPGPHMRETENWKRFSRLDREYFIPILFLLVILPCVFIFRRNHSNH